MCAGARSAAYSRFALLPMGVGCGETTELDGREPIINTPPHLSRHLKEIRDIERFWLEQRKKRVRGCNMASRP